MSKPTHRERLLHLLAEAISDGSFAMLVLARPVADGNLKSVRVRPVVIKGRNLLQAVHRRTRGETAANHEPEALRNWVAEVLGRDFLSANLFTSAADWQWESRDGRERLVRSAATTKPVAQDASAHAHDTPKARPIAAGEPWLATLGVTTPDGAVRKDMAHKYRQINRFVELLGHLVGQSDLAASGRPVHIVDMGCGKGYLTFATWQWFNRVAGIQARVTGIELRPALVDSCNALAKACGFETLGFRAGTIADAPLDDADVVIALHAGDTATDDALLRAIRGGARLIVTAPCCHKEIRSKLRQPAALPGLLEHGILLERHAELLTDAIRALCLEASGYRTKVFEFVGAEDTPKNLMLAATRLASPDPARQAEAAARIRNILTFHGLDGQRLASQLGLLGAAADDYAH